MSIDFHFKPYDLIIFVHCVFHCVTRNYKEFSAHVLFIFVLFIFKKTHTFKNINQAFSFLYIALFATFIQQKHMQK